MNTAFFQYKRFSRSAINEFKVYKFDVLSACGRSKWRATLHVMWISRWNGSPHNDQRKGLKGGPFDNTPGSDEHGPRF